MPDGAVECNQCADASGPVLDPKPEGFDYEVDWSLLKTVEDFRTVIAAAPWLKIVVKGDTPEFDSLKQWLRRLNS